MSGTPSGPSLKRKFVSPYVGGSKGSPAGGPSSSAGSAKRAPPPPSDQPEAGPSRQSANTLSSASRGYNTAPAVKRNVFYGIGHQGEADGPAEEGEESYWMVQWRKPQTKKHKTWDGDGILIVRGGKCTLKDTDGKDIGSSKYSAGKLSSGDELKVGGKELEVDVEIQAKDYLSGACFGGNVPQPASLPISATARIPSSSFKKLVPSKPVGYAPKPPEIDAPKVKIEPPSTSSQTVDKSLQRASSSRPDGAAESPLKRAKTAPTTLPRFDPKQAGAVVMKRPPRDHQAKYNPKGYDLVDVVLDPVLSDKMRPHQKEGVKFMYECVMALRKVEGTGAILADEMGLGKTLQTIALIWTLLKQSPYVGPHHQSVIGKALIVCPVSLTENWKKEFHKWLGRDTIGVFVGDGDKSHIKQFATSRRHQVLIIGYEKLRTVIDELKHCQPQIGLIVCDEGHRLKSKDAKTSKMFDALRTKKRIILSGTPLQNDLGEFWSMVNFINPGILDSYPTFTKIYEKPILRSRDPNASQKEIELGSARGAKLSEIGKQFILRRTADILSKFLPPKHEYVVFVAPTKLQLDLFKTLLAPATLHQLIRGTGQLTLGMILYARNICNSPFLFHKSANSTTTDPAPVLAARALIPSDLRADDMTSSGKLIALANLLKQLKETTNEKVVLVSLFTTTLDILEAHLKNEKYKYERLDGSTHQSKRQGLVDRFNRAPQSSSFVFLLSSKSGGAGLNLIGASRLIMFDSDWNPSTDAQAMARIHRDGQKLPVFIYRFLTTGTIDESILQRQITKLGLSSSVMNHDPDASSDQSAVNSFSPEELKALFTLRTKTGCYTHDLLGCDCLFEDLDDSDDERPPAFPKSTLKDLSDDSSSDEDENKAYISTASDIRPENTAKKDRKAAAAKASKLAALLKEFSHIDCISGGANPPVQDSLLKSIVKQSYIKHNPRAAIGSSKPKTPAKSKARASRSSTVVTSSSPPPSSGRASAEVAEDDKGGGGSTDEYSSVLDEDDFGDQDPASEGAVDADVEEKDGDDVHRADEPNSSPPAPPPSGRPPKKSVLDSLDDALKSSSTPNSDDQAMDVDATVEDRSKSSVWGGVDLEKMARDGQGGRVCFLFERVATVTLDEVPP